MQIEALEFLNQDQEEQRLETECGSSASTLQCEVQKAIKQTGSLMMWCYRQKRQGQISQVHAPYTGRLVHTEMEWASSGCSAFGTRDI